MFDVIVVLIPGLPLLAAIANSLNAAFGERYSRGVQVGLTAGSIFGSLVAAAWTLTRVAVDPQPVEIVVYRWLWSGDLSVNFGFLIDPLSAVMMLVTTSISFLIAVFSINYMHNESGFARFFSVLPLFVAAMLVLVMANNYVLLFLGWESVGVCSYLLISFYQDRPAAARAGTKAFVMNRVGDAGFLIAIFLIVTNVGTTDYLTVFSRAAALDSGTVTAICVFLTFGAIGKSAQLPLATWLARAMEGPTPSSALIHAATMVTAGVYMVTRSQALYAEAPNALLLVAIVGAATAVYGALVGLVQTDIKSILAYSTTTQLGLMFLACGLGAYAVAIFHLAAHAVFKTLLFLTAPSILHHLHGRADVRRRGPARHAVPAVAWAVLVAATALLALPFASNWWPIDVGGAAWRSGWPTLIALGLTATLAAAVATGRMLDVSFGEPAHHDGHEAHSRPSPGKPLLLLAAIVALAIAGGVLPGGMPHTWFDGIVSPAVVTSAAVPTGHLVPTALLVALMFVLVGSGWFTALHFDRFQPEQPGLRLFRRRRLYNTILNRFWLDEIYEAVLVRPVRAFAQWLDHVDTLAIDWMAGAPRRPARIRTAVEAWEERLLAGGAAAPAAGAGDDTGLLAWLARLPVGDAAPPALGHSPAEPVWTTQRDATPDRLMPAHPAESHDRLQGGVSALTDAAAAMSAFVERLVFHTGVHIGMPHAGGVLARALIRTEERLGQPWLIGFILAVWVIAVLAGYGWS